MSSELEEYVKSPLWPVLVDTVHALVMYRYHKRYVSTVILGERPNITPKDLSVRLRIPYGEALVLIHELKRKDINFKPQTAATKVEQEQVESMP